MSIRSLFLSAAVALSALATPAAAEVVGEVGVDWVGNDIIVEAVSDPKIKGITCHVTYFDRSIIDRLSKGNWFEEPSDSAISCQQTGPITIHDIDLSEDGEEVFKQGISLIFRRPPFARYRYLPLVPGLPGRGTLRSRCRIRAFTLSPVCRSRLTISRPSRSPARRASVPAPSRPWPSPTRRGRAS